MSWVESFILVLGTLLLLSFIGIISLDLYDWHQSRKEEDNE